MTFRSTRAGAALLDCRRDRAAARLRSIERRALPGISVLRNVLKMTAGKEELAFDFACRRMEGDGGWRTPDYGHPGERRINYSRYVRGLPHS
jgi:hypothetical protein